MINHWQVYIAAIAGYVPSSMVQAISAFMEACYVARRNAITASALERFQICVDRFHDLRKIFIHLGVRESISLPRQHALSHFYTGIQLFASPNGLCTSITESKHIKAVKQPWRRSSRYKALNQMLCTILRMEKMAALERLFIAQGMMQGTTASYTAKVIRQEEDVPEANLRQACNETISGESDNENEDDDGGPIDLPPSDSYSLCDVKLAGKIRKYKSVNL